MHLTYHGIDHKPKPIHLLQRQEDVTNGDDDVTMAISQGRLKIHEINTPLCKGPNNNHRVNMDMLCMYLMSKDLKRVTLINHNDTIFEYCRPKVSYVQYLLGNVKTKKMTTARSSMEII
jgi:hypothetical protein